jgi:hypothetical protein
MNGWKLMKTRLIELINLNAAQTEEINEKDGDI